MFANKTTYRVRFVTSSQVKKLGMQFCGTWKPLRHTYKHFETSAEAAAYVRKNMNKWHGFSIESDAGAWHDITDEVLR